MRQFKLLKDQTGAFELLPVGPSFVAMLFHVFWAAGNGLFVRCVLLFVPGIVLAFVSIYFFGSSTYEDFGFPCMMLASIASGAAAIYFGSVAHKWREEYLVRKGFELIATISGRTAQLALNKWALSKDADKVLD